MMYGGHREVTSHEHRIKSRAYQLREDARRTKAVSAIAAGDAGDGGE